MAKYEPKTCIKCKHRRPKIKHYFDGSEEFIYLCYEHRKYRAVYDAEVVRHAKVEEALKAELDTLKSEHAKTQQQLAEYRQTLAELSKTNSKLVKDIAALSVCGYRCAKIGDTYKCGHNDNFGNPCDIDNCNILRANDR